MELLDSLEIFALSIALGMDLFSAAVPIGMNHLQRSVIWRASLVFAVFHVIMLLGGYYIGRLLGGIVEQFGSASGQQLLMVQNIAGIFGALVLVVLGIMMLKSGVNNSRQAMRGGEVVSGWALLVLALGVSVDAFAAGFSFGMLEVGLVKLCIILGCVIFAIAWIGLSIGRTVESFIGGKSELLGGAVLIIFGCYTIIRML